MLKLKGTTVLYALMLLLILGSCDLVGGNEDEEDTVTLTTSVTPEGSGTVDPSSGEFDSGQEIAVQASANDGWIFDGWTGDIESPDNPLAFTINENTSLTANFREAQTAFTVPVTVGDGTNSIDILLGMAESATDGYDDGVDEEAPPKPPEGAFYGQFSITDYNLVKDMRGVEQGQTIWTLEFSPESGNSITLSWDVSNADITGTLTLVDDVESPSLEIDMLDASSHNVSDTSVTTLYIVLETES